MTRRRFWGTLPLIFNVVVAFSQVSTSRFIRGVSFEGGLKRWRMKDRQRWKTVRK